MTAPEYIQLRAFARVDGLKLFLLWLASFACYVAGLSSPGMGFLAMGLAVLTPLVALRLLRRFRNGALDGVISFGRGWGYVVYMCFYASLLFAVAQFVYFSYLDHGYFAGAIGQMLADPATAEALKQMGMEAQLGEATQAFSAMRPIDLVLNIMTSNLLIGCLLALPLAAIARRSRVEQVK